MQLQQRFFLSIAALTILPLLILQFGVVERNERTLENRVTGEILGTLDKLAAELETLLDAQRAMVRGLGAVPAVERFAGVLAVPGEPRVYRERAEELRRFFLNYQAAVPSIQALRVMDSNGNTLVKVKEHKVIEPVARLEDGRRFVAHQGQRPFFREIAATLAPGAVGVSDFELGQVTPEAEFCPSMLRYITPLEGGTAKPAFLVVNVWGKRIDEVIAAALGGYGGQVMMAALAPSDPARDGVYLYHPDDGWRFANQLGTPHRLSRDLGPELWQRVRNGPDQGSLEKGEQVFFYRKFRPYPHRDNHWLLVVRRERMEFLGPVLEMQQTIWVLLAVLVLLGLAVARWSSTRMARPVQRLAHVIRRYANGEDVRYRDGRRDEIGQAGRAFNDLADTLARVEADRARAEVIACQAAKMATVGELAAGVAHEINNPLNNMITITGFMESAIAQGPGSGSLRDDFDILRREQRRCADIVQGLLDFGRPRPPARDRIEMHRLVEGAIRLLASKARSAGVIVKLLDTPGLPPVQGDGGQLEQVMVNLLLNAIQESPKGSEIRVRLEPGEQNRLLCRVEDEGAGVDEKRIPRIFEPFYTTKLDQRGTGLGLSISYSIIQRHGGDMGARPGGGGGLVVWFTLPHYAQAGDGAIPPARAVGTDD